MTAIWNLTETLGIGMRFRTAGVFWVVSGLSLAGLGLATYLTVVYLAGHGLACGPGGGCASVTTSRYAVFLGIPVAMMGVGGYSLLLLGSLAVLGLEDPPDVLRYGLLGLAGIGVLFSAYLTATQAFLLHSFCIYCLTSASIMVSILLLTLVGTLAARSSTADFSP